MCAFGQSAVTLWLTLSGLRRMSSSHLLETASVKAWKQSRVLAHAEQHCGRSN